MQSREWTIGGVIRHLHSPTRWWIDRCWTAPLWMAMAKCFAGPPIEPQPPERWFRAR